MFKQYQIYISAYPSDGDRAFRRHGAGVRIVVEGAARGSHRGRRQLRGLGVGRLHLDSGELLSHARDGALVRLNPVQLHGRVQVVHDEDEVIDHICVHMSMQNALYKVYSRVSYTHFDVLVNRTALSACTCNRRAGIDGMQHSLNNNLSPLLYL